MLAIVIYLAYVAMLSHGAKFKKLVAVNRRQAIISAALEPMKMIGEGIISMIVGIFLILPLILLASGGANLALACYILFSLGLALNLFALELDNFLLRITIGPILLAFVGIYRMMWGLFLALPFWVLILSLTSSR